MEACAPDQFYLRAHRQVRGQVNYLPVKTPRAGDLRVVNVDRQEVRELVKRLQVITVSGSVDEQAIQETIALLGEAAGE